MTKEKKTHYRKVFKSDHLGVADLEDFLEEKQRLVYTIEYVKQEIGVSVAGRKGNFNIAYFKEDIKPLVLNATNGKIVKSFAPNKSSFVEDWKDIIVELYIDSNVKLMNDIVGGVRIRPKQPAKTKPVLNEQSDKWATAAVRVSEGMTYEELTKHYTITKEDYKKLCL